MKYWFIFMLLLVSATSQATTYNIAPKAHVSASSQLDDTHAASNVTDLIVRVKGHGSWASSSKLTFWGEISFPWIQLDWNDEVETDKVVIYDRPESGSTCSGGELVFSDGSRILVREIPADGSPMEINFPAKKTKSLRFVVTDGDGDNIGLSEMEVYSTPTDYVSSVNPYIETTRGRYFFFATGSQPFGMISAAPLTRNKNQGGGGYNYNAKEVLGFPQIHAWMLSGLDFMPITGEVQPEGGEQEWKSEFSHAGEIAQPAYQRLFLERYHTWVEQTNTDRASLYRMTYTEDAKAGLLLNLGGYIGTTTMVNAHVTKKSNTRVTGYFDTTGRLWGGPESVRIFFVAEFSKPFETLEPWGPAVGDSKAIGSGLVTLSEAKAVARNKGMSYYDAPAAGVNAVYNVSAGEQLMVKFAVSYTNEENAEKNLDSSITGWDFDAVRASSQNEWNDWFGKIAVSGGKADDRMKFYTDLWHALLGRHKLDDVSGNYPDYTHGGTIRGSHVDGAQLRIGQLPMDPNGKCKFHIYNSDALWLSQWNLNPLWGLAYPNVLDDFAASFIQYSLNGGLLARGPNAGGYSFIMSGCPATSLIASAYQQGLTHKWQPEVALREMIRNHEQGGMQSMGTDKTAMPFYKKQGYVPDNAGLTVQWSFEDWALSEMAAKMGKKKIATYFHKRSEGWTNSFNPDLKLILPRRKDGSWLHTDPLNGQGYIEANAWQATFGLSQDLPKLAQLMGGTDTLCAKLNYAFEQSASQDFMTDYGNGYVNYGNQPGLSNAHVFTHAGKPWLSQYWVRRVRTQTYGGVTPDKGYGGHDEDQGQMGALSALMSIGLFSIDGCASGQPTYDITSPIFDNIKISLDPSYYKGKEVNIIVHDNTPENCYIQNLTFNGKKVDGCTISHKQFTDGGTLEIWLGNTPKVTMR